jgi:hypothetical protein
MRLKGSGKHPRKDKLPGPDAMERLARSLVDTQQELVNLLTEGRDAMRAFETFLETYKSHSISPRLRVWLETVNKVVSE